MTQREEAVCAKECQRCGDVTDERHPVPPEVMTRELLVEEDGDRLIDRVCDDCIRELMAEH